jgi:hypothetical protein
MNLFVRTVTRMTGGRETSSATPGPDRAGRGMQPPTACENSAEDAAVRAGTATYQVATGKVVVDRDARRALGTAAHYAFGAAAGVMYGVLAPSAPGLTSGRGIVYGSLVWALADQGLVPALGLSRSPKDLDGKLLLYTWAGHLVYGMTLDGVAGESLHRL